MLDKPRNIEEIKIHKREENDQENTILLKTQEIRQVRFVEVKGGKRTEKVLSKEEAIEWAKEQNVDIPLSDNYDNGEKK